MSNILTKCCKFPKEDIGTDEWHDTTLNSQHSIHIREEIEIMTMEPNREAVDAAMVTNTSRYAMTQILKGTLSPISGSTNNDQYELFKIVKVRRHPTNFKKATFTPLNITLAELMKEEVDPENDFARRAGRRFSFASTGNSVASDSDGNSDNSDADDNSDGGAPMEQSPEVQEEVASPKLADPVPSERPPHVYPEEVQGKLVLEVRTDPAIDVENATLAYIRRGKLPSASTTSQGKCRYVMQGLQKLARWPFDSSKQMVSVGGICRHASMQCNLGYVQRFHFTEREDFDKMRNWIEARRIREDLLKEHGKWAPKRSSEKRYKYSLGVVTSVYRLTAEGVIRQVETVLPATAQTSGSNENIPIVEKCEDVVKLPQGMIIAYELRELIIDSYGSATLALPRTGSGSCVDLLFEPIQEPAYGYDEDPDNEIMDEDDMCTRMNATSRDLMRSVLVSPYLEDVCYISSRCTDMMLDDSEDHDTSDIDVSSMPPDTLAMLKEMGFQVRDDGHLVVEPNQHGQRRYHAFTYALHAANELRQEQIRAVCDVSEAEASVTSHEVLQNALFMQPDRVKQIADGADTPAVRRLLQLINIIFCGKKKLVLRNHQAEPIQCELIAARVLMYAIHDVSATRPIEDEEAMFGSPWTTVAPVEVKKPRLGAVVADGSDEKPGAGAVLRAVRRNTELLRTELVVSDTLLALLRQDGVLTATEIGEIQSLNTPSGMSQQLQHTLCNDAHFHALPSFLRALTETDQTHIAESIESGLNDRDAEYVAAVTKKRDRNSNMAEKRQSREGTVVPNAKFDMSLVYYDEDAGLAKAVKENIMAKVILLDRVPLRILDTRAANILVGGKFKWDYVLEAASIHVIIVTDNMRESKSDRLQMGTFLAKLRSSDKKYALIPMAPTAVERAKVPKDVLDLINNVSVSHNESDGMVGGDGHLERMQNLLKQMIDRERIKEARAKKTSGK